MAEPNVVVMNDTDVGGYHFGCARVMSIIHDQLARTGVPVTGTVPVGVDWRRDHAGLVGSADLLVINGEGTLHHGSRKGRWLLEAGAEAKARGARVALINALWQENPVDWAGLVAGFDVLACRDSRSSAALGQAVGREVLCLGDLSMSRAVPASNVPRSGVVIGDSVHADVTAELAALAGQMPGADILPVTSDLKFVSPHLRGLRRGARAAYARMKERRYLARNPAARFLPDEAAYLTAIQSKELSVTGRFHAVCLALVARTPFVAVRSNSWKIEALIEDVGLNPMRVQPLQDLTPDRLRPEDWAFSDEELYNIERVLGAWQGRADEMFDQFAGLMT